MTENTPKIHAPRVLAVTDENGELIEYTIQTDNRDAVRFDIMRARKGWPDAEQAPMLYMGVLCWSAMRREGLPVAKDTDADKFLTETLVSIAPINDAGELLTRADVENDATAADPTQPGADTDY